MSIPRPPMYCLDCDYQLGNLTTNQCPECGRAFNPNDMGTVRTAPKSAVTNFIEALMPFRYAILGVLLVAQQLFLADDGPEIFWLGLGVWITVVGLLEAAFPSRRDAPD